MAYKDKLKNPKWQKKRLEIMNRDKFTCQYCGSTTNTLCVHHAHYFSGLEPWEYPGRFLKTICEQCHNDEHSEESKEILDEIKVGFKVYFSTNERRLIAESLISDNKSFINSLKKLINKHG